MNLTKSFARDFSSTLKTVESKTSSFLKDPVADNVHDLRTSIRRAEASIRLLPKNLRSERETTIYLKSAKDLFRATTEIRDIDIISSGLSNFKSVAGVNQLLVDNEKKRALLLGKARKVGTTFQKAKSPRIRPNQLSERKLEKRRKKISDRLGDSLVIQSENLLLNRDPTKLHEFRKTCKQLRYTLEIYDNNQKKLRKTLVMVQKILGTFMDLHTIVRYLSSSEINVSAKSIAEKLEQSKIRANDSFFELLKSKFMGQLKDLSL